MKVTRYHKWSSIERTLLLFKIDFHDFTLPVTGSIFPKLGTEIEVRIYKMRFAEVKSFVELVDRASGNSVYYKITGVGHWFTITHRAPKFWRDGLLSSSSREGIISFPNDSIKWAALGILNSSIFYWYFQMRTNCRDFNPSDYRSFPIPRNLNMEALEKLGKNLGAEMEHTVERARANHRQTGAIEYEKFRPRECKEIIDQIDTLLAKHDGFTDEELDFIINYDIKYRMGLGSGVASEEGYE